ncbi:LysR family transcriptional regulator [Actinomadura sp. NBRC 104412]|uniref:LysR family transcriptional regulator n=1 Tax=Actinomadura sp. NBRC 104412 TaxID=3032203 RepID=UPI0024A12D89|nr:LysR family transcriptional regulator [Actinomadura sp. NBRC 104412]GLZ07494.1 LysR family transcriptional regulator [Actinomadura sp. NBRC 104412]
MDVDTRLLRYFLAVAEDLSFTKAAERLFLSQPALSKQIRHLETTLGTELFVRTSRTVRLSAAGAELLPHARAIVTDWQTATRRTLGAAARAARVLRIGFAASGAGLLTTRSRAVFSKRYPDVTVEAHGQIWGGEVNALREGLVDVAFIWLPADETGLHLEVVASEMRYVGLAAGHALAKRDSVGIRDLRDEPIAWTRKAPREWVDWWAVNPRSDGSEPVWGPVNDNVEELLEDVASGAAICISPASMAAYYTRPDLVWLPIIDIEPLRIALGWLLDNTNPLVEKYAEVTRELVTNPG